MFSTLTSIVANSFAGLGALSTPEVVAATALLAYAIAGLAFVNKLGHDRRAEPQPKPAAHFKTAA
jgi:hypothetical protein